MNDQEKALNRLEEKLDKIYSKLFEGNGTPAMMTQLSELNSFKESQLEFSKSCKQETSKKIEDLTRKLSRIAIILFVLLALSNIPQAEGLIKLILTII